MNSLDPSLLELGWKPFFGSQLSGEETLDCVPVRVMAVHRGQIAVAGAGLERLIASRFGAADAQDCRAAVGDWLLIDRATLVPARIMRRESLFQRRSPGSGRKQQLIAANVDTLFIVVSCDQDFNLARLERYLVLAREVAVRPVVVLTKIDLTDTPEVFAAAARQLQPELLVELINARDEASVARLASWCSIGQTVALLGSSGVGKSTLVNTLRQSDSIATQAVSEHGGKGQHTTTVRQMHRLAHGGWLLDTPGMRELQLPDVAVGLAEVFDDIVILERGCRFANCTHRGEPDCTVRDAVATGALDQPRLDRWRKLAAENVMGGVVPGKRNRAVVPGSRLRSRLQVGHKGR